MSADKSGSNKKNNEHKHLLLRVGVIFFVSLFAILWILNLRQAIFDSPPATNQDRQYWRQLYQDFITDFNEISATWSEFRTDVTVGTNERFIEELKKRAEAEVALKTGETEVQPGETEVQPGETESQPVDSRIEEGLTPPILADPNQENISGDCPEIINCPPTADGLFIPCPAPPGCEGITRILYCPEIIYCPPNYDGSPRDCFVFPGCEDITFINRENIGSYCPEYINCMPIVDGPPIICQAPPGCENITIILH